MTSRLSSSVEGIESSVRERAEAAARRAGLSLNDWMETVGMTATGPQPSGSAAQDIAEIHNRLNAITRQIEQMTAPPAARGDAGVARQLNDAISRLDARLSQMSRPPEPRPASPNGTPLPPVDFSIAEIVARQGQLSGPTGAPSGNAAPFNGNGSFHNHPPHLPPQMTAPLAPAQPDLTQFERQLSNITSQIEALHRRPDPAEQVIAAFRGELSTIRAAITEALPRRAIESLENEIRSLGRRIDETHQHGVDGNALASIERALSELRNELRSLTPAEQLAGFDEAIRNLGGKVDAIVRANDDPRTMQQLNDAIAALKSIVANIASGEALAQLSDNLRTLSAKVDQLTRHAGNDDTLAALEQRIAVLTSALEQRERPAAADSSYFDNAVRTISDRLDNLQVGHDGSAALGHVEQRIAHLIERIEATQSAPAPLGHVEDGLSQILRLLQEQRAAAEARPPAAAPMDPGFIDALRRELSDMRQGQSEIERRTQDSLEAVHSTLGHVVDRLAQIEGDLHRRASAAPPPPVQPPLRPAPQVTVPSQLRPELPNPALAQAFAPTRQPPQAAPIPAAPAPAPASSSAGTEQAAQPRTAARTPIAPDLPPDQPLEPGSRMPLGRASSSERIAASESALQDIAANSREPVSSSNFIQAARRAAQAAQSAQAANPKAGNKPNRVTTLNDAARAAAKPADASPSTLPSKIRAVLVGVSVVVIVLATAKLAINLLASGDPTMPAPAAETRAAPPLAPAPAEAPAARPDSFVPAPSMTSPTPLEKQSQTPAAPAPGAAPLPDVTGTIPAPQSAVKSAPAKWTPVNDKLPDSIGSASLRSAALKGDPAAAYEIGLRYAEGRGVAANFEEAAKWYGRAAQGNVVPALFRLGTLYEKGLGEKKDLDAAARYYQQAAERGNAKAMHNLAVLSADGGGKSPNYQAASDWFRKAAERGVADSQFNLGILYARGIGVEQNLAESYKWFSLAAAQGDTDAGRKRDDVGRRLDAQSLAAARLAVQTFAPEQQPADAVNVAAPAGGWDAAPKASSKAAAKNTAKTSAKAAAKPLQISHSAAH
ncbi:MAG: SEL1-like repeat protein [Rhizobiales bacterium]|nr:SEL1-like repeat protein [Hyphomicrobiales bacterium]